jgi:hypothetical protein
VAGGELSWNGIVFCAVDPGLGKVALTFHFLMSRVVDVGDLTFIATGDRP